MKLEDRIINFVKFMNIDQIKELIEKIEDVLDEKIEIEESILANNRMVELERAYLNGEL